MSDEEDRINIYILSRATNRLNSELTIIDKYPIPGIDLRANKDNILEWHFVIHGKEDTPYYGGMYHGKLIFPSNFPFSPPKIIFLTPNGRFKTNERICFSLSDFNPEEWKPAFSITAVLQEVRDFMHDTTETIGSIETSKSVKRKFAENSSIHNGKDANFCHLFPQLCRRRVINSEDSSSESSPSKNTISPVREKTQLPTEITLPPRTQSLTSPKVTIPITDPTSLPPPGEFAMPKETLLTSKKTFFREEPSSPREINKAFNEKSPIPSRAIQKQKTITSPPNVTPSATRPMFHSERYPETQPSSREVRPSLQNVSRDVSQHFTLSLPYPTPKNLGGIPADDSGEYRKLPSIPVKRSPDAANSQIKLSSSEEKLNQQIPSPENIISLEKTPLLDKISPLPRNQSPISTEVTLPPTVLIEIPPSPPGETAKPEETILTPKKTVESREESSSPREIIKSSGEESRIPSETIQEQRTITPPTHITPSVTRPMFYPVRYPGAQPSLREERPHLQNVYRGFTISPTSSTPKNHGTNSQISETIGSEEIPSDNPDPSIKRSPGATDSQRKLPSLPKENIHRQIPSTEKEISSVVEKSPVGDNSIQKQSNIAPPPHTTPSVNKTIHDPVKHGGSRHSKRKVRIPAQIVSQKPFIRSPIYPKQRKSETNPENPESIELEEIPAHPFGEYGKLPSPPIISPGTTHSQGNLPFSPKVIIPRQTPTPEREICPDIERSYPSIGVITPVDGESLDRQEADVEKTPLLDKISPLPRNQSPISTEVTLPPTHPTPVLIEIPPSPPGETAKPEETILTPKKTVESREESSSPREIIKSSGEESRIPSETIQEQRTITPPTHITPSLTWPMFYPVRYPGAQPSLREERPRLQNVYRGFTISPTSSTPKNHGTNSQISETIGSEEIPSDNPDPSIKRSPGATDSQRKLPSLLKEIIPPVITHPSQITHFQRISDEDRVNSFNLRRATKRLNRELTMISKDPIPGIDLRASKDNILEWHFVIHGKEATLYYGGMYHGKLIFPSNFPFAPPSIIFLTPNGRFMTNERICFSISDFHPEQWKPSYSVVDLLYGVRDFMHENTETLGSIETSESEKRQLAESSSIHNGKDTIFCQLFPKLCGRKVTDSEDSSNKSSSWMDTISLVRENSDLPVEISLSPRTQSLTSTEITLPPRYLTPVLSTPPTHTTPSVTRTMSCSVIFPRAQPSSRKARPPFQNVSQGPFTISPTYFTPPLVRYPGAQSSSRKVRPRLPSESLV